MVDCAAGGRHMAAMRGQMAVPVAQSII